MSVLTDDGLQNPDDPRWEPSLVDRSDEPLGLLVSQAGVQRVQFGGLNYVDAVDAEEKGGRGWGGWSEQAVTNRTAATRGARLRGAHCGLRVT